jgi:hypothetical protein
MQVTRGEDNCLARFWFDGCIERWKRSMAAVKIIVKVQESSEVSVWKIVSGVRVRQVVSALSVTNHLRARVIRQFNIPNLTDQWLDDVIHSTIKLFIDVRCARRIQNSSGTGP